jgi:hypothetical protein
MKTLYIREDDTVESSLQLQLKQLILLVHQIKKTPSVIYNLVSSNTLEKLINNHVYTYMQ